MGAWGILALWGPALVLGCVTGGGICRGEALPRCHALLQALSQALRDASTPFPCVGCTNITELLK